MVAPRQGLPRRPCLKVDMIRTFVMTATFLLAGTAALADPCTAIPDKGPTPAYLSRSAEFSGRAVYIADGDGLCVALGLTPDQWVEVRLQDFYAPELNAPGGQAAKQTLSRIVAGRTVKCRADHRSYDRIVSTCWLDGRSVGDLMRRAGVAEGGNGR